MNARMKNLHRLPRGLAFASMLAVVLGMLVVLTMASEPGGEDVTADEPPVVQIRFDQWRTDLPAGVSVVVVGGGVINNGFPALSADRSQIALLYYAGHPLDLGYPRFEVHSTSTLALQERIELLSEQEQQQVIETTGRSPNLRDPQLLTRIEGLLDDINGRLREGSFRTMETLFELPRSAPLDGVESLGKRIDYPRHQNNRYLTITSLVSGLVELKLEMRGEFITLVSDPEMTCGRGADPEQAWYDQDIRTLVIKVIHSSAVDGCELPDEWLLKRL